MDRSASRVEGRHAPGRGGGVSREPVPSIIGPGQIPSESSRKQSLADQFFVALILQRSAAGCGCNGAGAAAHRRSCRPPGCLARDGVLSIAGLLSWVLRASHSSNLEGEIGLFFRSAGVLALLGVIFWTLYVAVESVRAEVVAGCAPRMVASALRAYSRSARRPRSADWNGLRRGTHSGRCGQGDDHPRARLFCALSALRFRRGDVWRQRRGVLGGTGS